MSFQLGRSVRRGFPLPEWLPPLTRHFQDWVFDAGLFESTQRLPVPIVK